MRKRLDEGGKQMEVGGGRGGGGEEGEGRVCEWSGWSGSENETVVRVRLRS